MIWWRIFGRCSLRWLRNERPNVHEVSGSDSLHGGPGPCSGYLRAHTESRIRAAELAHLLWLLQKLAIQPPGANQPAERTESEAGVGVSDAHHTPLRDHAHRGGWRDVFERTAFKCCCAGRSNGPAVLALPAEPAYQDQRLLRPGEPRSSCSGGPRFHRNGR